MVKQLTLGLIVALALALTWTQLALAQNGQPATGTTGVWGPPAVRTGNATPGSAAGTPAAGATENRSTSITLGGKPSGAPATNVSTTRTTVTPVAGTVARQADGHFAKVKSGNSTLPRTAGQVWRDYDISPYTSRVKENPNPEQVVIDWILRDTGTKTWFSEPLGILSATKSTIRVYHTPEVQEIIHNIIDRFVHPESASHALGIRLVTVGSPNWRSRAFSLLRPVGVQTPGVQAWLVSKEHAAMLLGELRTRSDFQEHQDPNHWIGNGLSSTISRSKPRTFVQSLRAVNQGYPHYEPVMGRIDEGYSLAIDPLLDVSGRTMEAVIKCEVTQVEKFQSIAIEVPTYPGKTQRMDIQVPQVSSWKLSERFRWPADQVLLLSCGVVATPGPEKNSIFGIPNVFDSSPGRADALLFIEARPLIDRAILSGNATGPSTARSTTNNYGRY